jgi:Tripartite tricarboxylate transporter TctB family
MMSSITKYSNSFMTLFMLVIFTGMVVIASRYPAGARFMPFVLGFPAIALCLLQLFLDARERRLTNSSNADPSSEIAKAEEQISRAVGHQVHFDVGDILLPDQGLPPGEQLRREAIVWGYFLAFILGIILFGFHLSVPIFLVLFLRYRAEVSWRLTIGLTASVCVFLFAVFEYVLRITLHTGFITDRIMDAIGG